MSELLRQLLPSTRMFLKNRREDLKKKLQEPKDTEDEPTREEQQMAAFLAGMGHGPRPKTEYQGPVMLLPAGPPVMGPDGRMYAQRQRGIPLTGMGSPGAGHGFFERKKK